MCDSGKYDINCHTLGAVNGSDGSAQPGCSNIAWPGQMMEAVFVFQAIAGLYFTGMCIYLIAGLRSKGADICNATGSTIIFSACLFPMMLLWYSFFFFTPLLGGHDMSVLSLAIGLPGMGTFMLIAWLNLALMWIQVAESSKSLKSSGKNISNKFR
jgi:hypothetical protein